MAEFGNTQGIDIEEFRGGLDFLFEQNRISEVEPYLESALVRAIEDNNDAAVIFILNEMIGFYRETCEYDKSVMYGEKALMILENAEETGSIPYATTKLNLANALRAAGRLEESLEHYLQTEAIYKSLLVPEAFDFASLYNNMSLLFQEMGDYEGAIGYLERSMEILESYPDRRFELAVTHANLGNSMIGLYGEKPGEADINGPFGDRIHKHLTEAVNLFHERNENGAHLAAALCGLGDLEALRGDTKEALRFYISSMEAIDRNLGRIEYYYRVKDKYDALLTRAGDEDIPDAARSGLEICRRYFNEKVFPMIEKEYPELVGHFAAGLFGEGSDAYGYDDLVSRDHDWGPGTVILINDRGLFDRYGQSLTDSLIRLGEETGEFMGFAPDISSISMGRRGVFWTDDYYRDVMGGEDFRYIMAPEYQVAAAVNGEVFYDPEQTATSVRKDLDGYFPENIYKRNLMQECALFSQELQYNYLRSKRRKDELTAEMMLSDGLKHAARIRFILAKRYIPHDKWLYRGLKDIDAKAYEYTTNIYRMSLDAPGQDQDPTDALMRPVMDEIDAYSLYLQDIMVEQGLISRTRRYMEDIISELNKEELVRRVVEDEWRAFDKVKNEGGRADCQDNWNTFNIMRSSQYMAWDADMLARYAEDFENSMRAGWNPITEKYARMEESTAPEAYARIADSLPAVDERKRQIIEEIVGIQVAWMEEFAAEYPKMAGNARTIHTEDDTEYDTSYETYLRGEITTYSDEMLLMYAQFVIRLHREGRNLAYMIMENTARLYGYASLNDAEGSL